MYWVVSKKIYQPRPGHERNDLTPGKIYDAYTDNNHIVHSSDGIYWILNNDFDKIAYVHESHMIDLVEFRDSKLDDLGI